VPTLIIHGDADTTMSFAGSQAMYEHAKAKGITVEWLPVAGGAHTDAWAQPAVISQIFDFFDNVVDDRCDRHRHGHGDGDHVFRHIHLERKGWGMHRHNRGVRAGRGSVVSLDGTSCRR
jgi:fermentation-respiration switch protein FrsA (DUF1100 family)